MDVRTTLTVVTPAPSQDLVSIEDARSELGINNRQQDVRLKRYITQSSVAIATYTNRVWRQETVTEAFFAAYGSGCYWGRYDWPYRNHADGSQVPLVLKRYPVAAVSQVTVGGTVVDPATYYLDAAKGLLWRNWDVEDTTEAVWGQGQTLVDYVGGYAEIADVPADVQQACLSIIRYRYWGWSRDPTLRSLNVVGVQEETYQIGQPNGGNGAILPEAAALLCPHTDMRRY
jgi:hypothetical protein